MEGSLFGGASREGDSVRKTSGAGQGDHELPNISEGPSLIHRWPQCFESGLVEMGNCAGLSNGSQAVEVTAADMKPALFSRLMLCKSVADYWHLLAMDTSHRAVYICIAY